VAASGVMTGLADHDTQFGWLKLGALADSTNGVTGSQNWTFSAPDDYFDYLADGEAVTMTYTVEVDDHHGSIVTQTVAVTVNGSNDAPEVAADVSGAGGLHAITEQEGVTGSVERDSASGSVAFRDVDLSDTHTFGSSKPAFAWLDSNGDPLTLNATLEGVLRAASAFTLTPHDSTGTGLGSVDFSYSAADSSFDFLAAGEKLTITYDITVTDEHGAASTRPVTITVTGTNDSPVAVADTDTGHIVEAGHDADDNVVLGLSTTSGHVLGNDIDVDISDSHEVVGVVAGTVSGVLSTGVGKTIVGTYGSLVLDASGSWTYTLDNTNPLTNALARDAHVTDVFSYTESDHHGGTSTTTLTIDITGTNDAPVAAADLNTGPAVVERGVNPGNTAFDGVNTATGNVLSNDHDVDAGDSKAVQGVASGTAAGPLNGQVATSVSGTYGHVKIAADGTWTYALDNDSAATQALTQGQHVTDVFTYTMRDALGSTSSTTLTIDITGTNDAPTLADVVTAPLVDTAGYDSFATITGKLAGTDLDSGETATLRYVALDDGHAVNAAVIGHYGSLTVDEHGNYSYVPDAALINALHEGNYTDTFTVRTTDAHGATATAEFTVKVTGANDTPSIVGEVDPAAQIVVVAPAAPHVLGAGVIVNSLGLNTETFDGQTAGPVSSNGFGRGTFDSAALGAHFSASGNAGVVIGSSSVTAAPFVGPSPGHQDTTKYLSIGGNATETITFTSQKNVFGLYWGSVDSYNTIKFYDGTTLVASYTGADISPLLSNGNQGSFAANGYVEFSGLHSFNKVVLSSTSNAFEIDNISAGYIPPPTVKPVTGTLSVYDADIGDTLTAFVTGNATIDYNGSTTVPGGIDISALIAAGDVTFDSMLSTGGTAVLQWTYHPANANLDFLHAGDVLKIKFVAEVSDGHGHIGSQPLTVTLVGSANASTASAAGPVIATDAFTVTDLGNGVTRISGLHVTDADATASTDTFTVSAATGNAGTSVAPLAGSVSGVAGINAALNGGITYDPHGSQQADSVTLTVADSFGHTDRVHFIFNQGGAGPNVALTGTSGKDVIFATGHADTLTGGASADQFVFAPETSPSADTITDFKAGEDHIDLRSFSFVDSSNIATWLGTHAAASPANAADTLIALDTGDAITLKGVAHTSLHASDFIVSPHH
jgi:VCBS repeat-containing protein